MNIQSYECSFCNKQFNNRQNKHRHIKVCKSNPVNQLTNEQRFKKASFDIRWKRQTKKQTLMIHSIVQTYKEYSELPLEFVKSSHFEEAIVKGFEAFKLDEMNKDKMNEANEEAEDKQDLIKRKRL